MSIKEILEAAGVENFDEVATQIEEALSHQIEDKIKELDEQYDVRLAEVSVKMQDKAEEMAKEKLAEESQALKEWHTYVIEQELAEVENNLKVAADVKRVRSGMEKMLEGIKEAGVDITQVFENVCAAEVLEMQDKINSLEIALVESKRKAKAFQRAFIVSEATRSLTDVTRDAIVSAADAIDESIEAEKFTSLVKLIIETKQAEDKLKENDDAEADDEVDGDDEEEAVNEKGKKKKATNESFASAKPYQRKQSDVSRYFR